MVDGKYRRSCPELDSNLRLQRAARDLKLHGHRDGQQHIQYGGYCEHDTLKMDAARSSTHDCMVHVPDDGNSKSIWNRPLRRILGP
jgi:hypothetical protein